LTFGLKNEKSLPNTKARVITVPSIGGDKRLIGFGSVFEARLHLNMRKPTLGLTLCPTHLLQVPAGCVDAAQMLANLDLSVFRMGRK